MSEIVKTAPEDGLSDEANSTTEIWLDCSSYAGRYVHMYSFDDDLIFAPDADGAGTLVTGDAATPTALVPDACPKGAAGVTFKVDAALPFIGILSVAVATNVRVRIVPTSRKFSGVGDPSGY